MEEKLYYMPKLTFNYGDLAPHMSEEQVRIHYEKHHQAYVNGANAILQRMDRARKDGVDIDVKATLKELSFNIGGHLLHTLFWGNLAPAGKGGGKPGGRLEDLIENEFGSFERFRKEFSQAATSVEGSGWAALTFCKQTNRPIIMQIEKHNTNIYPMFRILMVLDVFEHAYYLDYKNDRAKFVEAFWKIVNWDEVNKRLEALLKYVAMKGESLDERLAEAIEEFNRYRKPEANAKLVLLDKKSFEIEFTGPFCKTCGFYDHFDDFRILLEGKGLKAEMGEIREIEGGAKVGFKTK